MLGISGWGCWLGYIFCILSTILCVMYGIAMWNRGAEVEGRKLEIEKREQGESQVAMVEESKGRAIPEGKRPRGRYTVNVASFRERVRVERLTKELEKKGYKAFVEEAPISKKGTWYRVAVGRFSSRGEAQTFARTLKEKEKMDSFVRELKEAKK